MKENFSYGLTRVCRRPALGGKASASYSTSFEYFLRGNGMGKVTKGRLESCGSFMENGCYCEN